MKTLFLCCAAVLLVGCAAQVPATKIAIPGALSFESPKQWKAKGLDVRLKSGGSFKAEELESTNSPDVIAAVAAANAQMADKLIQAMTILQSMAAKDAAKAATGGIAP